MVAEGFHADGAHMNKKVNKKTIRLALEVFNHALLDIEAYGNKDVYFKQTSKLTHLDLLEAEAIQIMREVAAEAENPVMLYSLGKDSISNASPRKKGFLSQQATLSTVAHRYALEVPGNV